MLTQKSKARAKKEAVPTTPKLKLLIFTIAEGPQVPPLSVVCF
jgi:hypothetical protein